MKTLGTSRTWWRSAVLLGALFLTLHVFVPGFEFRSLWIVDAAASVHPQASASVSPSEALSVRFFNPVPCEACKDFEEIEASAYAAAASLNTPVSVMVTETRTYTESGRKAFADILETLAHADSALLNEKCVLVGDALLLIGDVEIREKLPQAIQSAARGVPGTSDPSDKPTPESGGQAKVVQTPAGESHVYYFHTEDCASCVETETFLKELQRTFTSGAAGDAGDSLVLHAYSLQSEDGSALFRTCLEAFDVPEAEQMVPVVFFGTRHLSGMEAIHRELRADLNAGEGKYVLDILPGFAGVKAFSEPSDAGMPDDRTLVLVGSAFCQNCMRAHEALEELSAQTGIPLVVVDVRQDAETVTAIQTRLGREDTTVPRIYFGDRVWLGFNDVVLDEVSQVVGMETEPGLLAASLGSSRSLAVSTLLIGLVDGFNPCSLWALLFLVSMVTRYHDRKTIWLVGMTYVVVIALVYGLFMVGLFQLVMRFFDNLALRWGLFLFAAVFGALNVYGYFSSGRMPIQIPENQKKHFVLRIRSHLLRQQSRIALLAATVLIGALASAIELPCTAGFPVLWNAMMAEAGVASGRYFLLLALYLLMYVLIELTIVILVGWTMSQRYLGLKLGKSLKLVSGLLMVYLAVLLLLGPAFSGNPVWSIGGSLAMVGLAVILSLTNKPKGNPD